MTRPWRRTLLLLVVPTFLATSACLPKSKPSMVELPNGEEVEARQIRLEVYELNREIRGLIEESYDRVRYDSPDLEIRRTALEWKATTIPAMQRASFRPDPIEALIDLWLLVDQLHDFFESEAGFTSFGGFAPGLVVTTDEMLERILDFVRSKGGDPQESGSIKLVADYAAAHPIRHTITSRPTIGGVLTEEIASTSIGAFASVGKLLEDFGDLSDRLTIYAEELPTQARWQAELLLFDKGLETIDIDALLSDTARLGRAADHLVGFTDEIDPMIADQVEALLPEIERMIDGIDIDGILVSADEIAANHLAVALRAVSAERELILEAVTRERIAAMEDAEAMANALIDSSLDRVEARVEESMTRLLPWALALMAGPFVLGLLAGWVLRRRPAQA